MTILNWKEYEAMMHFLAYGAMLKSRMPEAVRCIDEISEGIRAQIIAYEQKMARESFLMPTHCVACGEPLMGGATVHTPECAIGKLIREAFAD